MKRPPTTQLLKFDPNLISESQKMFWMDQAMKNHANQSNKINQELGQTKNSAKLVLFIFGIGPIIGIIVFLFSKGFFNSPNM